VAALESRLYSRNPSDAVRVVADVALSGKFVTADGTTVRLHSLEPDYEGRITNGAKGFSFRNFGSQLFQMTAANIYWSGQSIAMDGSAVGKGNIQFAHALDKSRESYFLDISQKPPRKLPSLTRVNDVAGLSTTQLADINEQIVGRRDPLFALTMGGSSDRGDIVAITGPAHLRAVLLQAGREERFPIVISINTQTPAFKNDSTAGGGVSGHALTIVNYDATRDTVWVDNQWDDAKDHSGKPGEKSQIPLDQLYDSMQVSGNFTSWLAEIGNRVSRMDYVNVVNAVTSGLGTTLLVDSASGALPKAIETAFCKNPAGINIGERALSRYGLRAATTLGSLALVVTANDIHKSFARGVPAGLGRTSRTALGYCVYHVADDLARTGLLRLGVKNGFASLAVPIAIGLAGAAVYDTAIGDELELGATELYKRFLSER
jgi:hypothetical protein